MGLDSSGVIPATTVTHWLPAAQEILQLVQCDIRLSRHRFGGLETDVRYQNRVRRLQNRIVRRQRGLYIEHIEARAGEALQFQRFHQRRLVNNGSARRIYQDGRNFHFSELLASNKASCIGGQRHMQTDDIASPQQLIEPDLLDRYIINPEIMTFETEDMTTKGVSQTRNLQPDMTTSDNPQGLAE